MADKVIRTSIKPKYASFDDEDDTLINKYDLDGLTMIVAPSIFASETRGQAYVTLGDRFYNIVKKRKAFQVYVKSICPSVYLGRCGNSHYFVAKEYYEAIHVELSALGVHTKFVPLECFEEESYSIPALCHDYEVAISARTLKSALDNAGVKDLLLDEYGYKMRIFDEAPTKTYTAEFLDLNKAVSDAGSAWQNNTAFQDLNNVRGSSVSSISHTY